MVTVVHETSSKNQKTYANIKTVAPVPQAIKKNGLPDGINPIVSVSLEPETFNQSLFDSLSDGLKKKIQESPEYKKLAGGVVSKPVTDLTNLDEDVPF